MRAITLLLTLSLLASPAFAQTEGKILSGTGDNGFGPGDVSTPQSAAPTPKVATPAKQAIGYDPKVKRDAHGNIIEDTAAPAGSTTPPLRNDNHLRSDLDLLKKK